MANESTTREAPKKSAAHETDYPVTTMGITALMAGWLVPGAGHLIQKRWIRGLILMASIFTLYVFGLAMDGKIYSFNTGDLLEILGFFGDIGMGGLYFLARMQEWGQGEIHRAVADYGSKFLIVAGLLNLVSAIDAYHIGIGKKK